MQFLADGSTWLTSVNGYPPVSPETAIRPSPAGQLQTQSRPAASPLPIPLVNLKHSYYDMFYFVGKVYIIKNQTWLPRRKHLPQLK